MLSGFEEELSGAEVVFDEVVQDKNIITSRGMGTAIPFALKLTEYLVAEQKAEEMAEAIIYKQSQ